MYQFAIIGCGNIAHEHAREIARSGKLAAVCDNNIKNAQAFQQQYGGNSYTTIDDLLAQETDVQFIVICTPTGLHAEHAIKSLQAGKHVICERPLCITNAAAWQIIETARLCRRKLWIVSIAASHPLLKQIEDMIDANNAGEPISFQLNMVAPKPNEAQYNWKSNSFPGGNPLLVHFHDQVEMVNRLFGKIDQAATLIVSKEISGSEFEYGGTAVMRLQNEVLGSISWSIGQDEQSYCRLDIKAGKSSLLISGDDMNKLEPNSGSSISTEDYDCSLLYRNLYSGLKNDLSQQTFYSTNPGDIDIIAFIEKIYSSVLPQIKD